MSKFNANTISDKHRRFADEYLIDLNGTQAAIRAGYSAKTANEQSSRLLADVNIRKYIDDAIEKRQARVYITQDRILQELARIAFFDIRTLYNDDGTLKQPHELSDDAAAVLAGIETIETRSTEDENSKVLEYTKKAKVFDKNTALTLAMRHMSMLNDKISQAHSGNVGLSLVIHDTVEPDGKN